MPPTEQRIRGGVHACQRCRRRKQKCDQRYPQCSNCETANAQCLSYHPGKQSNIPRDYVTNLEKQIARLTGEVQKLRSEGISFTEANSDAAEVASLGSVHNTSTLSTVGQTETEETPPDLQDLVASLRTVVPLPNPASLVPGQSSGLSLAKMILGAIHVNKGSSVLLPEQMPFADINDFSINKASLPPRHVATHLVDVYFQYRTPHLPILTRAQVVGAIHHAYQSLEDGGRCRLAPDRDLFVAYMVFAIALVDIPHLGGRSSQSDGCFRSALAWIENILSYSKSDLDTLRLVLLLVQFVALSPSQGSLWHLTGIALRLCVDIGLHWETESQCLNMDAELLDDRRRLWHTTYHFDRLMSITLGRPLTVQDESIRVKLPNPWLRSCQEFSQQPQDLDVQCQRAHNHLFTLAKLESEIRHVQHSQSWKFNLAFPRPNWDAWLQDMQPRMQEWYATIPESSKAHPQSIFAFRSYWDVIYYNAVLLLYRPHSETPYQSTEALTISFDAAAKVITGLKVLQREGRVEMLWKSVHHLFMAGLIIIYGLWSSKEVRDRTSVSRSLAILQSCASTLSAMSETFKGAAGCRNAFEALSSATTDWLVTIDREESSTNRLDFENQVRELVGQLRSSREEERPNASYPETVNGINVWSSDNFDLSELLNAAAQWPDLGELDFIMAYPEDRMDTTISSSSVVAAVT